MIGERLTEVSPTPYLFRDIMQSCRYRVGTRYCFQRVGLALDRAVSRATVLAHPGHRERCPANLCHHREKIFIAMLSIS